MHADHLLRHLLVRHLLLLGHHAAHLLLIVFNKCGLHHVDAVLSLNFVAVMEKESLIARQFLLNWLNWHLINRLTDLKCIHGREQFFSNVQDIFREQGPF